MAKHSLAQIGVDAEATAENARAEVEVQTGEPVAPGDANDHFVERGGLRYAGSHLIIDLWDGEHLDDLG
jgi:S-adenosylmethionine decarboxylase